MINGWRLIPEKHKASALSGEGARIYGGRWNNIDTPVIYASEHLSLAVLEQFIHLDFDEIKAKYVYVKIAIPDKMAISLVDATKLPKNWASGIAISETKNIGTAWATKKEEAVLKVPSSIVPVEFNYVLNPLHPDFSQISIIDITPFEYDYRMLKH